MAQHIKLDQDKDALILDVAKTALRTAKSAQTRKGGSAFYPTGDGQGVLVGDMADHGVDKWDPETGEQSPLWEGISQDELDAKGEEILGAAKEDTAAQITLVNTTITEAQQAIEANREGIEAEAYLRAEGDKLAQDAAAAVKTETDRLSTKYDEMDTSVKNVKNDLKNVMTSTTQLEQDMIVSTLIEYAVGDSDTTPPDVTTYWMGEPNNSVSVLSDPWSPDTPERTPGTYVWMRTRVTFGDGGQETSAPVLVTGNTGAQGPQGVPGEPGEDGLPGAAGTNGQTSYLHLAYANSSDGQTGFSTSDSNRDYIGQYTDFTQQDSTDPSKYAWSKIKGATGAQGLKGDPGATGLPGAPGADGKTSYAHFAYANSADGKTDFSTTNGTNKKYIGQYVDFVEADSTDPTKYTWSLIVGPQGPQGPQGVAGAKGDKGEDGVTRYSYFAYGTSASGANFSTTPTSASTYIGVCVTTAATQPTDPTKYTWSLTKGATGPAGPQGAAGAKGDVGEDGKTYYTYFAYGTSASGANFSTTPTANSTYMGVCITLDATQPTTPASYTWSLTKGNQGAPGAQGVSVSALTSFWQLAESKPAQPVNKSPGGGWSSTEPAYVRGKKLWTCSRIDYSNGQWSWTSVQQSSAFEAAELALTTANGKNRRYVQPSTPVVDANELTQGDEWWQTSSKPPETYWMGEPNNSVSVLVDHSNEVEHIWVWNGKRWALNRLSAEDIIVSGSVAAGLVTADFFDGARIRGGEFVTSNELIRLNNAGLVMDGKSGERLVTLNATDGTATFQHVAIINGSLSVPTIEGGSIEGADYRLTTGSGATKQTIARINSDGVVFGDHLSYAKNKQGVWVLSLKGAIQSGGEISGPVITAPTIQTSGAENTGLKLTTGGLVAYNTDGGVTFTLDNTGRIMMAGALLSNATLTAPVLQTNPADKRGIKIAGNVFTAYSNSGVPMLSLNGDTGSAVLVGGFKTAQSGRRLEITNSVYGDVSVGAIHGYDQVGESWHIVGTSDRTSPSEIDNWYTASLGIGINPQQPEINIRYENRYKATVMSLLADRIDIIGAGDGRNPYGDGVYVNNRRIDWEQSWTNLPLANGATAVGTAQYGQRAGLLVFRGRIKCANTGDCDLFDLSSIYSGFETSSVNRTWIIGTMTKGVATTARAYIPANSTMLRVNNGPHDWADIGSIVIGL
ncbi:MAG: collagen-like protein [Bifidobacterium pseudolongum]|nr:collagen-like protein [Bifidobacterium pseudolongum]